MKELELAGINEKEKLLLWNAMKIFGEQGHSGGSAGFVIGCMKGLAKKKFLENEIHESSYLSEITKEIRQDEDEEMRYKLYSYLSKLMDYKPITPLTGEDDEWFDVEDAVKQNKRCSSLFKYKETGECYDIDGRVFNELHEPFRSWIGYSNNNSSVDVEFPYEPKTQYIHFHNRDCGIYMHEGIDPHAYREFMFQLHLCGIDPIHHFLNPEIIFIDSVELEKVKKCFDVTVKFMDLKDVYNFNTFLDNDCDRNPIMEKAYRLRALLGYNFKENNNGLFFEVMGVRKTFVCQTVMIPSKNYQTWIPYKDNNNFDVFVWNLVDCNKLGTAVGDYKRFYIDRFNRHSDLLIPVGGDTDDYLYQMRVKYGLKHPPKKHKSNDNELACHSS